MKLRLYQFFITAGLLFLIEGISFAILQKQEIHLPFFINTFVEGQSTISAPSNAFGYDEVDPLLGWSLKENTLAQAGFPAKNKIVQIGENRDDAFRILITGGSTTDMHLNYKNWPVYLDSLLKRKGIPATLYIASVAGYNSGQELLKLLRDGLDVQPHAHLSYSGANEFLWPAYTSDYENTLLKKAVYGSNAHSFLLPNTIYLMRRLMKKESAVTFAASSGRTTSDASCMFWTKNMRLMHAIAQDYHYTFFGILQPVLGINNAQSAHALQKEIAHTVAMYRTIYPCAAQQAQQHAYMVDFTSIFSNETTDIFIDDCHLHDSFQPCVAERVYELLSQQGLLKRIKDNP